MAKEAYTLVGVDGNAFSIMGYTQRCMKKEGFSDKDINETIDDATSGNYYHLLGVCNTWVAKCNEHHKLVKETKS